MAIDANDYLQTKEKNIKVHKKDKRLFLFDFRVDGKRYRKHFKATATNHTPRENLATARIELEKIKEEERTGGSSKITNLDALFERYMETQPKTDWTHKKQHIYNLYIGTCKIEAPEQQSTRDFVEVQKRYTPTKIGHRKLDGIKQMHVEGIMSAMEKGGLSPRTRKGILEVLNPLFKYAIRNKFLKDSPTEHSAVKIPSQKKIVTNATELFRRVYTGIVEFYKDEPFYKALFLFGFTGRRKSEILNLKWENIDLGGDYYWIEDTKNGEKQRYPLPAMIKSALLEIKDNRAGLVFKSPTTGKKMVNIDRQMKNLKEYLGVEGFTLHYMRNILVSALAEQSIEAVTLSGVLGHKDINTINKYLSNSTMKSGLEGLKAIDTILDTEVVGG